VSLKQHPIADSDMHVIEPPDLWERYIDPRYRHAAPVGLTSMKRDLRVQVKSRVLLKTGLVQPQDAGKDRGWRPDHDSAYAHAEARGWDSKSQLDAMDAEGLDLAVMFPSRGLFVLGLDTIEIAGVDGLEPDFAAAIARGYNDWMHEFCSIAPDRMFGAAMIAPHDVSSAVEEVRRCVTEYDFKAAFLAPGAVGRRPWHHRDYDPLWAECERLGIPIAFHGGGQNELQPDFSLQIFDQLIAARCAPRGQLCLGSVAAASARRALRVGRRPRGTRSDEEAVRVLPVELLPVPRGRRGARASVHRVVRRRQPRFLDRLPARRFEVSPLGRELRQAEHPHGIKDQDSRGKLEPSVRHPAEEGRTQDLTRRREALVAARARRSRT
jgi:hypothetical protein